MLLFFRNTNEIIRLVISLRIEIPLFSRFLSGIVYYLCPLCFTVRIS